MSEAYVECLVKAKGSILFKIAKILFIFLAVIGGLSMIFIGVIGLLICGVFAFLAYLASLNSNIEYEYLYLDRELTIDKVMAQTKRKKVATYSLSSMEIMAPFHSYHLDNYKNRQVKVRDFSIGEELKPDRRYVIYFEGLEKIIISPSEELIKIMKNAAPRKVFTD